MKIITSALALLTVLSVSIVAQTSSATEPVLRIKHFRWYENAWSVPCDDCAGLPQKVLDYRWSRRAGLTVATRRASAFGLYDFLDSISFRRNSFGIRSPLRVRAPGLANAPKIDFRNSENRTIICNAD